MPRINDLFLDDLELILDKIPQGSTITITKEELQTSENVFYLETDDTALLDEIEDILMDIEREEDDDDYEEHFDPDDSFDDLIYDENEDEEDF